jgi:hypothetical protein
VSTAPANLAPQTPPPITSPDWERWVADTLIRAAEAAPDRRHRALTRYLSPRRPRR